MADLTPKQKEFVKQYLVDLNATRAAIRAGYKERRARERGCRLLHHPRIQAALAEAAKQREQRTLISQDYVIQRLKEEAEYFGADASQAGRVSALKLLGQHLRMFTQRMEVEEVKPEDVLRELQDDE